MKWLSGLCRLRAIASFLCMIGFFHACPQGTEARPFAYVLHRTEDSVSVIDAAQFYVLTTVPVGRQPAGIVGSPDGRFVYVSNRESSSISVIDTAIHRVMRSIVIPEPDPNESPYFPGQLAIDPEGQHLYVALDYPDGCPFDGSVAEVDTATGEVRSVLSVVGEGHVADVAFGGYRTIYASIEGGCSDYFFFSGFAALDFPVPLRGTLTFIEQEERVESGDIVVAPGLVTAYVANTEADTVTAIDLPSLRRFDAVTAAIPVGVRPKGLALTGDGASLYVVNRCGTDPTCTGPGSISVVDTSRGEVVANLPVGTDPFGIALTPDEGLLYVTNRGAATVSVIRRRDQRLLRTISVNPGPAHIAIVDAPQPLPTATPMPCNGDCNGNGAVDVSELVTIVNTALNGDPADACSAFRCEGPTVTIDCIVRVINNSLEGCRASGT